MIWTDIEYSSFRFLEESIKAKYRKIIRRNP
jgi:hypothetical protein